MKINVGLVGTGFASRTRAQGLSQNDRAELVAVTSSDWQRTQQFTEQFGGKPCPDLESLLGDTGVDLVIISNRNHHHGTAVRSSLLAQKSVVVEYPLALEWQEAQALQRLAQDQNCFLHVEHIELLGGWHQALHQHLSGIGEPHLLRHITLQPKRPAGDHWTFDVSQFGFPLIGALSRIHRLTDILGQVTSVQGQVHFVDTQGQTHTTLTGVDTFRTCICQAQLQFSQGALAMVTYGKGEDLWRSERLLEIQGDRGTLRFDQDNGLLTQAQGETVLDLGSRRGLFIKDLESVLDHLQNGTPPYVSLDASLYALQVAEAIHHASLTGQTVNPADLASP